MTCVFGYGSLIFRPPPFELESKPGFIKGFVRRFAQASHDHRGTPEHPGRVVTLVEERDWIAHRKDEPAESGHVWGKVYMIPSDQAKEIWDYLDYREKDGYTLRTVDVYGLEGDKEIIVQRDCKVYVGETDNHSFAGGMPMRDLARHIATSAGPSGENRHYLYKLAEAIKELCPESEDRYLTELERLVREEANEQTLGNGSP